MARIARPRRAREEQPQQQRQADGDPERDHAHERHGRAAQHEVAAGVGGVDRAEIGAERELREQRQHDVDAERDQQRVEHRRADHEVEQVALDDVAEHEQRQHGERQRGERVEPEAREQVIADIGAQHDEGAVRDVDDVEDAPHEREAERHQRVQAAEQHAVDQHLPKEVQALRSPCRPRRAARDTPRSAARHLRAAHLRSRTRDDARPPRVSLRQAR